MPEFGVYPGDVKQPACLQPVATLLQQSDRRHRADGIKRLFEGDVVQITDME